MINRPNNVRFFPSIFLMILLTSINSSCSSSKTVNLSTLPEFTYQEQLGNLDAAWDNLMTSSALEIDIFLEPYKQSDYMGDTLTYLTSLTDAHVRIFDYLPRADVESFMVSGIGQCIEEESPDLYLTYLNRLVSTSDIKDELVMAALAKDVLGKNYDRRCLQPRIKSLKEDFENDDPFQFSELPATVINGYIVYGNLSLADWESLLDEIRNKD